MAQLNSDNIVASSLFTMLSFILCSLGTIVLAPLAGRYLFRKRVARDKAGSNSCSQRLDSAQDRFLSVESDAPWEQRRAVSLLADRQSSVPLVRRFRRHSNGARQNEAAGVFSGGYRYVAKCSF